MSDAYASRLSKYDYKGTLGLDELSETAESLEFKCGLLASWLAEAKHAVAFTGAGISTSAGIPDFRGPNGVWTCEGAGQPPPASVPFHDAMPTLTHAALKALSDRDILKCVVSQNVDGLHLLSGLPRTKLAELHGNIFMERCNRCGAEYTRESDIKGVGLRRTGRSCDACGGPLHDTVLDWEDSLPPAELRRADKASSEADLCVCLGTSLQIRPASEMPLNVKRRRLKPRGRLVICNLQPTPKDKLADLVIHARADDVCRAVLRLLNVPLAPTSFSVAAVVELDVAPLQRGAKGAVRVMAADGSRMPSQYIEWASVAVTARASGEEVTGERRLRGEALKWTASKWGDEEALVTVAVQPRDGRGKLQTAYFVVHGRRHSASTKVILFERQSSYM